MSIHQLSPARARLAAVLRAAKEVVSVELVSTTLNLDRKRAAKVLSNWRAQGWMRRVGPGLYVPVPLELSGNDQVVTDPWVLAPALFGQSYIGGWTAAHHWDLTEQLFNEIVVFTTSRVTKPRVTAQGIVFVVHHITTRRLYGLKNLWRGSTKVAVSDPARTLIDMLAMPEIGGGIDHVSECLVTYLRSPQSNLELLITYAKQMGNGAVFKRLGFLSDRVAHDANLAEACRAHLTQGYAKLDPTLSNARLVTPWRLWVPERWKDVGND